MSLKSLAKQVDRLIEQVTPPPQKDTRLPYVCLDPITGADLPGHEEHNQEMERLARRRGIPTNVYFFDVNEDGTEP